MAVSLSLSEKERPFSCPAAITRRSLSISSGRRKRVLQAAAFERAWTYGGRAQAHAAVRHLIVRNMLSVNNKRGRRQYAESRSDSSSLLNVSDKFRKVVSFIEPQPGFGRGHGHINEIVFIRIQIATAA
jgi:hypothetical protein